MFKKQYLLAHFFKVNNATIEFFYYKLLLLFPLPIGNQKLLLYTLVKSNKRINFSHVILLINLILSSYFFNNPLKTKKRSDFSVSLHLFHNGGAGGIRTLAPVTRSTSLAGKPLEPLEYYSNYQALFHYTL